MDAVLSVKNFIEENNLKADHIVVGLSGGADSVVMLHILNKLKDEMGFSLEAVHVNHGIRPGAKYDADFSKDFASKLGILFSIFEVNVPNYAKEKGLSLEEAGRILRRDIFSKIKSEYESGHKKPALIATAHHKDDNIETIIMNMIRGGGLHAMAGIRPKSGDFIHPILCLCRSDIEEYAKVHNLSFCTDETNTDTGYTRNRIRHDIIPYLENAYGKEIKNDFVSAATHFSKLCDKWDAAAEDKLRSYIISESEDDIHVSEGIFKEENPALIFFALRLCLFKIGRLKDVGELHFDALAALASKQVGKEIALPGAKARRTYEGILFYKAQSEPEAEDGSDIVRGSLCIGEVSDYPFPPPSDMYTKWIDCDKIVENLTLRRRRAGDFIDTGNGRKKLKDFLINEKVPKELRDGVDLVADGCEIVWVVGYRLSSRYKVTENTKKVIKMSYTIPQGGE